MRAVEGYRLDRDPFLTNFAGSLLGIALTDWLGADVPLVGLEVGPGPGRLTL